MSDYIVETFEDRRKKQDPIPGNLERILNKIQMTTLLQLESIGWQLWFVRRPLFQPVMPVIYNPSYSFTAIIEEDGSSNIDHGMTFRPELTKKPAHAGFL